ncbi:Late Golgi vesicles protein [Ascosphaera acerosa]|nr:Late Golgi vesicles protein [Ascosphaera acerosa]
MLRRGADKTRRDETTAADRRHLVSSPRSRLANIAVGVLMMLGAIGQFIGVSISSALLGVYIVLFALVTTGLEFSPSTPPYLTRYASFLFSFLGRGVLHPSPAF